MGGGYRTTRTLKGAYGVYDRVVLKSDENRIQPITANRGLFEIRALLKTISNWGFIRDYFKLRPY